MDRSRKCVAGLLVVMLGVVMLAVGANAEPGQDFWAVRVGNYWELDGHESSGPGTWTWSDEITGTDTTTFPGHTTYIFEGAEDGYVSDYTWIEVSATELYFRQTHFYDDDGEAWVTITPDEPFVYLRCPFVVMDTWDSTTSGTAALNPGGTYGATLTLYVSVLEEAALSVPAGTYRAYRVLHSLRVQVPDLDLDNYLMDYNWYVPYLGHVKWEEYSGGEFEELSSYSLVHKGIVEFDQDFLPDVLWRNPTTGANALWYMQSNGSSIKSAGGMPSCGTSWQAVGVADFDADGVPDIMWRNLSTGANALWYMQSNGSSIKSAGGMPSCGTSWQVAGVADFDGDFVPDILWRNQSTGANALWYMQSNGSSIKSAGGMPSCGTSWQVAGVGDFDRDEVPDILWRNGLGHNALWYMNSGGNSIKAAGGVPSCGTSWQVGKIADFDGDAVPDIMWRNSSTGSNALWYMQSNGSSIKSAGGMPSCGTAWEIGG